ncbi:hypothetical protein FNW02_07105 [Komarekiella sp. 'clone 1']|uniref:Uncharacterized protein n=1 Tax=Komarekiella delphini-convector SJRDD-AB1 TaxID=2593771 RepID=A0AA40SV34_9NOST|nr:hypothetical protein [Komarekiella delphini-convector]MBD6615609.1 hypothetical protein [Komarekiella delphini-convector SJRDD-AB1]
MAVKELLGQHTPGEINPNFLKLSETNLAKVSLSTEKLDGEKPSGDNISAATTPDLSLIFAPIVLLGMAGIIIFHKRSLYRQTNNLNNLHQSPCRNCRFFSNNNYLQCTVNPSTVSTKAAINCCDYSPLTNRKVFWGSKSSDHKPN